MKNTQEQAYTFNALLANKDKENLIDMIDDICFIEVEFHLRN